MTEPRVYESEIRVREITTDERDFYHEHGWVYVPGLISEDDAGRLLGEAKRLLGPSVESLNSDGSASDSGRTGDPASWFRPYDVPEDASELITNFYNSQGMGHAAARLLSNRVLGPRKARRLYDRSGTIMVKMPEGQVGSGVTPWHTDNSFPWDREGSVNFWLALVPCTPEMGSLRFLDHSHHLGKLGRRPYEDLVECHPGLIEHHPPSPEFTLRSGDALVNDLATVHGSGRNLTQTERWAYSCMYFAADICWTGQPHRFVDDLDLEQWKPFDHPRFRIVGES